MKHTLDYLIIWLQCSLCDLIIVINHIAFSGIVRISKKRVPVQLASNTVSYTQIFTHICWLLSVNFRPWIHVWNEGKCMMTEFKFLSLSVPLSSTGPPVPGEVQVQLTPGRSIDLAVNWQVVRGADGYTAVSSTGQNCSSSLGTYCIISPLSCSQNHTITVTAENEAGPSEPSAPQDLLTCRFYSHTHTYKTTHMH